MMTLARLPRWQRAKAPVQDRIPGCLAAEKGL
jgi:hypothetical protein